MPSLLKARSYPNMFEQLSKGSSTWSQPLTKTIIAIRPNPINTSDAITGDETYLRDACVNRSETSAVTILVTIALAIGTPKSHRSVQTAIFSELLNPRALNYASNAVPTLLT